MATLAAVMTGKGAGAIATIRLSGNGASEILQKIFKAAGERRGGFERGLLMLGDIVRGERIIDQVTVGCVGEDSFAINCHGNPLITADIMRLLEKHGSKAVSAEDMLRAMLEADVTLTAIAKEARIAQAKAKTLEGTQIILNQVEGGLSAAARRWMKEGDVHKIAEEARAILGGSRTARLIMFGCRIVLAGPANTGKSTLLNCLCGREKAIVADVAGTTRDWVSGTCRMGPMEVEVVDTAGLWEATTDEVDVESQRRAVEMLDSADVVLLVLDGSKPSHSVPDDVFAGRRVLTVVNKCDLEVPDGVEGVRISAKTGEGIQGLIKAVLKATGVKGFSLQSAVAFTERQGRLLKEIAADESTERVRALAAELLDGKSGRA
jgi:tRNA modification GTPase